MKNESFCSNFAMRLAAAVGALGLVALSPAFAEPPWKAELTSPELGSFPRLAPTHLSYRVSWNGTINTGKVTIDFAPPDAKKASTYVVRSSAASQGAAALLFPYKADFWSELTSPRLRPRYFLSTETDKRETATTTVRHFASRVESQEITKQLSSGVCKQTDGSFAFAPMFDLFSAMLHIRSQNLVTDDLMTLAIHPFDTPYLLRVKVVGRETHDGRNTIRLTVGLRKINRKTSELVTYKKLKQDATLWLSDDAERIPVEVRASAFIGDVRVTLSDHRKL
jgi:Protein of unknown function (DUF3108)